MNASTSFIFAVASLLLQGLFAEAQIIRWGSCESQNVTVMQNFNTDPYLGRWYEQERYYAAAEAGLTCVTAEYSPHHDGGINVNNTGVDSNGKASSVVGTGYAPDPSQPAKLMVKFPGAGPAGSLWIIDTDYTSYSVAYSCSNMAPFRLVNAWLLSRARDGFPHDAIEKVEKVLRERNIEKDPFEHVNQDGCTNGSNQQRPKIFLASAA
ncbi:putative Apolipoprotein D [Hypsibius exemplaris]|uniref:Apolipoprotein D n=1 Tax=Hypsibius exemplaris TaxID=2072580 RepID=A0A1W0XE52_HYPEX|nr:putative Apolipoprotein D [Hypsibius exemplaris]